MALVDTMKVIGDQLNLPPTNVGMKTGSTFYDQKVEILYIGDDEDEEKYDPNRVVTMTPMSSTSISPRENQLELMNGDHQETANFSTSTAMELANRAEIKWEEGENADAIDQSIDRASRSIEAIDQSNRSISQVSDRVDQSIESSNREMANREEAVAV